ncbi:YdcF family protein [Streptomyces gardneri]|uniref:YdcF family protein n=1 Tax=Nocardia TaxID=1817 RepID=UPI001359268A|nr:MULTISPECIES: YdcF family protein [Nocardia]MBF6164840.1 YdcF family protein [Streptomyces gardneri]MBF6208218.1 YdcF family protein [Streptomyces gardneri]UAK35350.1 YdcF family protein [Nocardia asteroides]
MRTRALPAPDPARPHGFGAGLLRWARRLVIGSVVMGAVLVGGTALRVWQVARIDDYTKADAIVVLGAAQYSGTPSSVFEARLDRAYRLFRAGVAPRVITVGGKQEGDLFTEAASGKNYLQARGVPSDKILAVETGSDTLRSVEAVATAMRARDMSSAVLVSDPWHSLRTRTMARDEGLAAWTAPTRTGPAVYTRESQAHGIARETGALLWYQLTHFSADFAYTAGQ